MFAAALTYAFKFVFYYYFKGYVPDLNTPRLGQAHRDYFKSGRKQINEMSSVGGPSFSQLETTANKVRSI